MNIRGHFRILIMPGDLKMNEAKREGGKAAGQRKAGTKRALLGWAIHS
jgi:hypothetical protein